MQFDSTRRHTLETAIAACVKKGREQERAAVVADIRAQAIKQPFEPIERHLRWLADRIERGDHRTEGRGDG